MTSVESPEHVLLLRGDGSVAAVRDAPTEWLDRDIMTLPVSEAVKTAAEQVLRAAEGDAFQQRRVEGTPAVTLVVHEAIPLRRSLVRVASLTMRILDVFASQAKSSRVLFEVIQAPDLPPVLFADEEKLGWVLTMLVGNALRIVSQPSRADVEPRVQLRIDWSATDGCFCFVVADNGPGMSSATARWLFTRDPRTGKPIGLALLMARDVIAAHRGSIHVQSELGEGASFVVRLPRGSP